MILDRLKRLFGGGYRRDGGLSCEEALARIQEFLDGELDPSLSHNVDEHFQVCSRCYPHLKLEQSFRKKVQVALREQEVPQGLRSRVLKALETDEG